MLFNPANASERISPEWAVSRSISSRMAAPEMPCDGFSFLARVNAADAGMRPSSRTALPIRATFVAQRLARTRRREMPSPAIALAKTAKLTGSGTSVSETSANSTVVSEPV